MGVESVLSSSFLITLLGGDISSALEAGVAVGAVEEEGKH